MAALSWRNILYRTRAVAYSVDLALHNLTNNNDLLLFVARVTNVRRICHRLVYDYHSSLPTISSVSSSSDLAVSGTHDGRRARDDNIVA